MEIFFAYSRILKKQSEKLRQKVPARVWPNQPTAKPPQTKPASDQLDRLRLASVCQNADH